VDEFSARSVPSVAELPRVGGLYNPSLEAVVALEPDRVVVVPSVEQRDFRSRLERLGIEVSVFENISFEQVMENIQRLGALVGRQAEAEARVSEVRATWRRVERLSSKYPSRRTLLVLQRDPLFVIGRGSFIDEMLVAVGGVNLAGEFEDPYPRVAVEWLVSAAPAVLVDLSPGIEDATAYWARWPALPAVQQGRIVQLDPNDISLPGPHLDRSIERLAMAVHGPEMAEELARDRSRRQPSAPLHGTP
jgi:iron complex transport system substrate-binding protein